MAEVRHAERVQSALYRIADLASAAEDMQAFYRAVHAVVAELMEASNLYIALYDEARQLINYPYYVDSVDDDIPDPSHWDAFGTGDAAGTTAYVLRTGEPQLLDYARTTALIDQGEVRPLGVISEDSSWLGVPLKAEGRTVGVLAVQSYTRDVRYSDQDKELLAFVGQHIGTALARARAIEETRQRNAELALINGVQEALAGKLDLQAIYDAVGDRIQEIFDAQVVDIGIHDAASGLIHFPYAIERGVRYPDEPIELIGYRRHVLETREPLVLDEVTDATPAEYGNPVVLTGEPTRSAVFAPLLVGSRATGVVSLQNVDREHAFSESDVQLLQTLCRSLSVALENARLVHETRQRNAELSLINSVQEGLAGELELQAIYDLVGDKIQEIFDAQVVDIGIFDFDAGLLRYPYAIERGVRYPDEPAPIEGSPLSMRLLETRAPLLVEDLEAWQAETGVELLVAQGEPARSMLLAPLFGGGEVRGRISLQNLDRTHAFSHDDLRLLTTLASSLSVALENARLVHETRQRNAELALINSVQEAIAGELDQQAIYDLVGDRIQEIFDAQVVDIGVFDLETGMTHYPYTIERGRRLPDEQVPIAGSPLAKRVLETKAPVVIDDLPRWEAEQGETSPVQGEPALSVLAVPLITADEVRGRISLQNLDRTNAFSASDVRLLTTLAGSLSVALENARLVHETRQRNAELALINSVQESIAGELDQQAIYDLVGEKLREVFDAQVVDIGVHDEAEGILRFVYQIERGVQFPNVTMPVVGFRKHVIGTRKPLAIHENMDAALVEYGNPETVVGEPSHGSAIFQPLVVGGRATGVISIQNLDREHAFSDSDQRLLATIASSLGVALENAQLVHETRQRNAELALINGVQDALAGELELQAIYDVVGDRIQEVFDAQVVDIGIYDESAALLRFPYTIERGVRFPDEPIELLGFRKHVMETGEPLMINENAGAEAERYGNPRVLTGDAPKASLFVPLAVGGRPTGVISLQNVDREHAFTEADQRLLVTLARSVSVALENARLVHETRRRAEELATVNSVGQALAAQLDLDALIELVGERVRETFDADIAYVALHDVPGGKIDFAYYYESGERRDEPAIEYGQGLTSQIIDSREPLLLNREAQYEGRAQIGTPSRSYLGVPILVGDEAIGVVSVQSIEEEGRFGEAETGLLATIASNVGVAIHNARLFAEIGRQKQYLESLVEITPVAVVTMDADERVTGWNPAAAELFGHAPEDALGRPVDDLVFGEDARDEGREITREALRTGRAQRITRRRRKDGTSVDVELMLVPLVLEGERAGFLAIYHDITELQRARQEAEAATQAKSAFLATMSHEIRTPMNAVIGMTGLLLDTELTSEQREFAEVVRSSGDALLHVIDDILDYSKIEAGKLELEREPVDLRECVEGALEIVAPRAWEKAIELGCLIDEDAPPGIVGDAGRLRQVLLNLLSNAVKFTEEGEVVVDVTAVETEADAYRLEIAVRDTGIGIPTDRMDKLFESFSQVDASTTRRYGGTGLGLAISKRLVGLMGGSMRVESEVGGGSTFRITLPVQAAELPERGRLEETLPQLAGKRVLVVDDNATNREIVARHARSWAMEPVSFEGPAEALARIVAGEPFDVGVLDMMMPLMDGLTLAREIRRHRDEHELPLVLLTSLGRLPKSESAGDFAVQLAKPVRASQLYNALLKALAGRGPDGAVSELAPHDGTVETSPLRILLAEDNAVNQKVALRLLDRLGYRADVVWNGREAVEAIERTHYDVVLMDVQMPELDGLDASRRICARWAREERPRIVAMTANAMPEDREACLAAGMDDYVAKPIRPEALAEALRRVRPRAQVAAPADSVRLETSAVASLRELGGDAFLAEVIALFLTDGPVLLQAARRALDEGNAEELRRAAHTLKSNGATLGANDFAERCRALEQCAKSGRIDEATELVAAVEQAFEQLRPALASLRPQPVA